jgi:acyl-CoA synthetase (AMP-forming)/AMP-acid ligase II
VFIPIQQFGTIHDTALDLRWDAAALDHEVERRAAVLTDRGVGRGATVLIGHGGSARFFADLFAIWSVGATAACLDPALTALERHTLIRFSKAALLLTDNTPDQDGSSVPILNLSEARATNAARPRLPSQLDGPALVLFTSGTTGAPKGVVLTFRAIWTRIALNIAAIGRPALRRSLVTLPMHFGHGLLGNALTPLLAGGDLVLHPRGVSLAQNLDRLIDEHAITFLSSVPALWRMVLKLSNSPRGRSLIRIHVGSAPLSAGLWLEIARWSGAEVVNCYGTTETANWIGGASSIERIAEGLIGRPWGGFVGIKNESGAICSAGEGEIVIQSPSIMSGYLDRPDLTAAVLHDGWYHTGDRGRVDESGRIWLLGRIKDEINRAGFKVQPAELDLLLERHPAVAEACVFGVADPVSGEAVAAAVKLVDGAAETAESLRAWCRQQLRREAVPEHWYFVDQIPRTARGKISRQIVRRTLLGDRPDHDAVENSSR